MNSLATNRPISLCVLRWFARVWSLLAVGVILLFAIGEGLNFSKFSARDLTMFAFFPVGIVMGMVLAWRWESIGGGITIASLAVFYAVDRVLSSRYPGGFSFLVLAAPGFLFLVCRLWTLSNLKRHVHATPDGR